MSTALLLRPSLSLLGWITRSKSRLLNPDLNPLMNWFLRHTIYNHFCSGETKSEVLRSAAVLRTSGFHGIILGHAREIVLGDPTGQDAEGNMASYGRNCFQMVEEWKQSNMETLKLIGKDDFLSIKITGAGPIAVEAVRYGLEMPAVIRQALEDICRAADTQTSRVWMDAEQQALQPGIDSWTIELMTKYNIDGKILVYNTIQAYLKGSEANLDRHISLAAKEGWGLGVKHVRGAYIDHEVRSLVHDTKEATDQSYDICAEKLLCQQLPKGSNSRKFPDTSLFLATHNAPSTMKALELHRQRVVAGLPTAKLECGQIDGMADELSYELIDLHKYLLEDTSCRGTTPPKVFKYMIWGTVSECMGYLHRRAIENRGAVERTKHTTQVLSQELRRRIFR